MPLGPGDLLPQPVEAVVDLRLSRHAILQDILAVGVLTVSRHVLPGGGLLVGLPRPAVVPGVIDIAVQPLGGVGPGDKAGIADVIHGGQQALPIPQVGGQLLPAPVQQAEAIVGLAGVRIRLKLRHGALQLLALHIADGVALQSDGVGHGGGHPVVPALAQRLKLAAVLPIDPLPLQSGQGAQS